MCSIPFPKIITEGVLDMGTDKKLPDHSKLLQQGIPMETI